MHSSVETIPVFPLRRGIGVKKFGGKFEPKGREAALAADSNDARCPAGGLLERKELKITAARGSIMGELV